MVHLHPSTATLLALSLLGASASPIATPPCKSGSCVKPGGKPGGGPSTTPDDIPPPPAGQPGYQQPELLGELSTIETIPVTSLSQVGALYKRDTPSLACLTISCLLGEPHEPLPSTPHDAVPPPKVGAPEPQEPEHQDPEHHVPSTPHDTIPPPKVETPEQQEPAHQAPEPQQPEHHMPLNTVETIPVNAFSQGKTTYKRDTSPPCGNNAAVNHLLAEHWQCAYERGSWNLFLPPSVGVMPPPARSNCGNTPAVQQLLNEGWVCGQPAGSGIWVMGKLGEMPGPMRGSPCGETSAVAALVEEGWVCAQGKGGWKMVVPGEGFQ